MESFTTHTGKVIVLPMSNVDTDMIIPAQFLTNITKEGYAATLFRRLRDQEPNFPFNLKKFEDASVLVAGDNFGCGSSREHAVWALLAGGIRVVIAKSFADIFFNNSAKNGLLLVTLQKEVVDGLMDAGVEGTLTLTVDLPRQTVVDDGDARWTFSFDGFRKHCLVHGVDELDYILSQNDAINAYHRDSVNRYFVREEGA